MPHLLATESAGFSLDVDRPFDASVVQDLELDIVLDTMADGDAQVRAVARAVLLQPLQSRNEVIRRQDAIEDCRLHPAAVAALDAIAVRALQRDRSDPLWMLSLHPSPTQRLSHSAQRLAKLIPLLDEVRAWSSYAGSAMGSSAFRELRATIEQVLDDEEMQRLRSAQLEMTLPDGILVSAALDGVGQVARQRLRRARRENRHLLGGSPLHRPNRTYRIAERDQAGFDALAELGDRGVRHVADVATDAVAQLEMFFAALHDELAFLVASERLRAALETLGVRLTRPEPAHPDPGLDLPHRSRVGFRADGLMDPSLALRSGMPPVANDVVVGTEEVLVITGANHGGKSTLLRAIGVAQLMLQSGLPVAARSCTAALVGRVHTHWPRSEDEARVHGKLDDELARMSAIVDAVAPGDLLLSNESFSSTDEMEGAAIALEVVTALRDCGARVALVTHLWDLADALDRDTSVPTAFLRAPRDEDGARSFQLEPGPPLPTSYGMDLFDQAFGTDLAGRSVRAHDREEAS